MYKPVYAPSAVTHHGEWVMPETVMQEDYDSLFCEYCRVNISVVIDELTSVKSFVHTPRRLEMVNRLATCPYSKGAGDVVAGKQSLPAEHEALRPVKPRQLPCKTTKQNWHCCWCNICWDGEKVCPQCEDWIYAIST